MAAATMQGMDLALAQITERVRTAAADQTPLRIRGGGTKDFHGLALHGEVLDTRVLRGIVSYEPSELVVTVRAGTPLADLKGPREWHKEDLLEQTLQVAEQIATRSLTANMMLKETINRAFEVNLTEGLRFERRMFHSIFATADQKEGMQAFVEKRQANFKNQ